MGIWTNVVCQWCSFGDGSESSGSAKGEIFLYFLIDSYLLDNNSVP
jgi:hypothetical protein